MEKHYDVVIVGAGPAGCMAGLGLRDTEHSVLVVDRRRFPREKLCGGAVTGKSVVLLRSVFGEEELRRMAVRRADHIALHHRMELLNTSSGNGNLHFVNRRDLDALLFSRLSAAANVTVRDGVAVEVGNRSLTVDGRRVSFRTIVGADGVHSATRAAFGRTLARGSVALAVQAEADPAAVRGLADLDCPHIFLGYLDVGWCWVFPKPGAVSVGLGGLCASSREVVRTFRRFVADLGLDPAAVAPRGAVLPYGTFLDRPAAGNCLLVGDAAGFVEPVTGEGIYYALLSGSLAAQCIRAGGDAAAAYNAACAGRILAPLRRALLARRFLFHPWIGALVEKRIKRDASFLDNFFALLAGDCGYFRLLWRALC